MKPHGTITRYRNNGCRCDECKAVQREYVRRNRAQRLAEGRLTHGTRSAWDAGCRCDDCHRERLLSAFRLGEYGAKGRFRRTALQERLGIWKASS